MKPLGENIAALRAANGWTLQELAANVRRCGAPKVQHQHLQQLEAKPNTRPRYLIELACAFGKTVEELRAWVPGMPVYGPHATDSRPAFAVRDPAGEYGFPMAADERRLIDLYRDCGNEVRKAVLVMMDAAGESRTPRGKPRS